MANQAGGDDQRVRVVQRAAEAAVEVDLAARDGVDAGQPRRCGRIDEEADEDEVRSRAAVRCGRMGSLPGGAMDRESTGRLGAE